MKTVILLRHAKSSWDDPALADIDRPLNPRGKASAPVMARWLEAKGLLPDLVLCSPSQRTRQTVGRMRKEVPEIPEPAIVDMLYEAAPEDILAALRAVPPAAATVMVVSHEPTMSSTAELLSDETVSAECAAAFGHFPTAAVAVFEAEGDDWAALGWGQMRFRSFVKPRDLMAGT